jgi:hypothetical protein
MVQPIPTGPPIAALYQMSCFCLCQGFRCDIVMIVLLLTAGRRSLPGNVAKDDRTAREMPCRRGRGFDTIMRPGLRPAFSR